MLLNLMLGPLRGQAAPIPRRKFPHSDDAWRHPLRREFPAWQSSPSSSRGRIRGSQLDDYSRCCDTPPFDAFTGTNPLERICSGAFQAARRIIQSPAPTRGTLSQMICRDCAALEAMMCVRLPKNFVRCTVPRMIPIIRAKKQNYSFAIDLAHISFAKFGWLSVAPTRNDVSDAP